MGTARRCVPRLRPLLAAAVTVLTVVRAAAATEGAWQRVGDRDGVAIETRALPGTSQREVRATAHAAVPPATVVAVLWDHRAYPQFVPHVRSLDVLRDDGDTRLIYERIGMPVVKDRDVTLRVTRTFDAASGVWEIVSDAAPDAGPPVARGYVRVQNSHSVWRLVPANGGTDVSYDIRTVAGGLLPGWIVAGAQKDGAAHFVRAVLDRARQSHSKD